MNNLIGLVGFAGSGKDTVGNILRDKFGYQKYSFAGPLKDIVSILFSWDRELLEGSTEESRIWRETPDKWWTEKLGWKSKHGKDFTPRICLQYFGTDLLRNHFDENIWITVMERYVMDVIKNGNKIVITDCRFNNEIKAIKNNSGEIIRVRRGTDPNWFDMAKTNIKEYHDNPNLTHDFLWMSKLGIHHSEVDWIDVEPDKIIENNSTINDIINQL